MLRLLRYSVPAWLGTAAGSLGDVGDRLIRRLSLTSPAERLVIGILLGLVWRPSVNPTPGVLSVLAAQRKGLGSVTASMLALGAGTMPPMLVVALLSCTALLRWRQRTLLAEQFGKAGMGVCALTAGTKVLTDPTTRSWCGSPPATGSAYLPGRCLPVMPTAQVGS